MATLVDVSLTTKEAAVIITQLQKLRTRKQKALYEAQRRAQETGVHKPGEVSGKAMELADLQELTEKLVKSYMAVKFHQKEK